MKNPEIVPATPELLTQYYGKPVGKTVRGIVAIYEGVPLCVAGVYQDDGKSVAFAGVSPAMRGFRKTGVKMGRVFMNILRERGVRVCAMADCNVESSERFLEYLGFEKLEGKVYLWTP